MYNQLQKLFFPASVTVICFFINVLPVRADLVGCWECNENTGTTVSDSTANGNDGTLSDSSMWSEGICQYSLSFDGTDDYVDFGTNLSFTDTDAWTFTHWIKWDGQTEKSTVFYAGKNSTREGFIIKFSDDYKFGFRDKNKAYYFFALDSSAVCANKWTHLAWVADGNGNLTLYINGIYFGTLSNVPTQMTFELIGRGYQDNTMNFKGEIDQIKIFDTTLNAIELDAIIRNPSAYWKFDSESGGITPDETDNDNDGTLTGGASICANAEKGNVLSLDGTDDYVDFGTNLSFTDTDAWTFTHWIKWDGQTEKSTVFYAGKNSTREGFIIKFSDDYKFGFRDKNKAYYFFALDSSAACANKWTHLAWVADGNGNLTLYINGIYFGTLSNVPTQMTFELIGRGYQDNTMNFKGEIDQIKIFDRFLTADELLTLYNTGFGLRGCWEMDSGSGTKAFDTSKHENHASFINMNEAAWTTGHVNQDGYFRKSLTFNGTGEYLNCGNDSIFNFSETNKFTISCWIKPGNLTSNQGIIGKWGGSLPTTPFRIIVSSTGAVKASIGNGTSYGEISLPTTCFSANEWRLVTISYDGSILRGYVNGEEITSTQLDYTITSNNGNLEIGRCGSYYFNGCIDKVHLFEQALPPEKVEILYYNLLCAYPNKTYYTTENPVAVCSLAMPAEELTGCYLVAKDDQGTTLGTNTTPENGTDLTFNISSLANGENTITVELRQDGGSLVFDYNLDILKLVSNSGLEVKIDRKNGIVLHNGSSFFPVGIYMNGIASDKTTDFEAVANAGFNSIIRWDFYADPSDSTTYLENAYLSGLFVVDFQESYTEDYRLLDCKDFSAQDFWDAYKGLGEDPYDIDQSARMLSAVGYSKLESNFLSYYSFDEPHSSQAVAGQDLYERTNDADGYHPTVINGGDDFYPDWCDIICSNPYWVPPSVDGVSSIDLVSKYTVRAYNNAKQNHKALWIVLMGEYSGKSRKRAISPEEQCCQTYLALIHGAKGLFYYFYPIRHQDSWDVLADLTSELADLASSMMEPELTQTITYYNESEIVEFDPVNDQHVDVQARLFSAPSGAGFDYILLAANTQYYPVDVDFTISRLGASGTVSRLFDTDTYTVTNSAFSDQIEGFGTRAYTFSSTSAVPVIIGVDMTPGTAVAEDEPYPDSGRPNCTNLMQNPSLEDNVLENWPDYCWPRYAPTPRINAVNQGWGLVTNNPYHGSKCLKITSTQSQSNGFFFYLTPEHEEPNGKNYTFSVYLKADRNDLSVRIGSSSGYNNIEPTTTWARYDYTCSIPEEGLINTFYVKLMNEGTIWVDAVQVEATTENSPVSFTTN